MSYGAAGTGKRNAYSGLTWEWSDYAELSLEDLHDLLRLRQQAFVVEQACAYADIDGKDPRARHLLVRAPDGRLAAYLRAFGPGEGFAEASIGRIVVDASHRDIGLGRALTTRGIEHLRSRYPGAAVRIEAQAHLEAFYASLGFETVSEPYDLDGIPHLAMVLGGTAGGR